MKPKKTVKMIVLWNQFSSQQASAEKNDLIIVGQY